MNKASSYVDQLPQHAVALAAEMRRLSAALLSHPIDPTRAGEIRDVLAGWADEVEARPEVLKVNDRSLQRRVSHVLETGEWPPAPPDGSHLEFDPSSIVGGPLNPSGLGADYYKDGNEVVGKVNIGRCFEGPPERVHGGVLCAIFDEVLGSVFRANGTASAFTGELTVRFEGPAPLNTDVEFRGRQAGEEGRKRYMEGEATGPDGQFASAKGIFIEMRPDQFRVSS